MAMVVHDIYCLLIDIISWLGLLNHDNPRYSASAWLGWYVSLISNHAIKHYNQPRSYTMLRVKILAGLPTFISHYPTAPTRRPNVKKYEFTLNNNVKRINSWKQEKEREKQAFQLLDCWSTMQINQLYTCRIPRIVMIKEAKHFLFLVGWQFWQLGQETMG